MGHAWCFTYIYIYISNYANPMIELLKSYHLVFSLYIYIRVILEVSCITQKMITFKINIALVINHY
jgi:hypothetical protein